MFNEVLNQNAGGALTVGCHHFLYHQLEGKHEKASFGSTPALVEGLDWALLSAESKMEWLYYSLASSAYLFKGFH